MSVCGNCKAETTRIRTIFSEDGAQHEECPNCAPESFEKFTAPSDKKIWMGYEAHPEQYEKKYDAEGVIYERKLEYRKEQETALAQATEEEREAKRQAEAKKRAERRTLPMDAAELSAALHRAEEIADWVTSAAAQGTDVN